MCELFDQYTRKGINLGISQEISRGIELLITTCKELGASFDVTAEKVRTKYNLEDADVQQKMKLYW